MSRPAFLIRDNIRHRRDIEDAHQAIAAARRGSHRRQRLFPARPALPPSALGAAKRGVRVTPLTQGWTDHLLQQRATRALYGQFLAGGVRIFEYHRSHLHAKVAVVDERWATVGSSNIDPFSPPRPRSQRLRDDAGFAEDLRLASAGSYGRARFPPSIPTRLPCSA